MGTFLWQTDAWQSVSFFTKAEGQLIYVLNQNLLMTSSTSTGIKALGAGPAAEWGVQAAAAEVSPQHLKELLTFPHTWGPTEWGPMPYLPDEDALVTRMENQWGNLLSYRGINSTTRGTLLVPGVQLGKLWIGIQPLLGLEGDPMRLLFERDLTPHPQYAAAYKWLQQVRVSAGCFLCIPQLSAHPRR